MIMQHRHDGGCKRHRAPRVIFSSTLLERGQFQGQSGAAGIRRDEAPGLEAATLDGPPLWAWGLQRSGPSNGRDRGGVIIDTDEGKR